MVNLNFSPPGIYEERGERPHTPVTLRERGVVGFVGLAQRGPMNTPVRVTEYERFRQIYGALDTPTYLESALKSFFENGGQECYVLRVAHMDPRRPGEVASAASARLPDREGRNTVLVEALNEGDWGNGISVEAFAPQQVPQTFLTLDLHEGQTSCTVKSTHGIERGTVLRAFDDDGKEEIFTVHAVSGHTVYFPEDQAATMDHPSSAPTYVEPVFFGMRVSYLGTDEVFDRVDLGEHSGHYVETVINGRSNLIRVRNLRSATDAPGDLPEPERKEVLEGGRDGMFAICPDDFIGMNQGPGSRYGLAAFEIIEDVDLLCVPDLMWAHENSSGFNSLKDVEVVQQAMLSQCENLRDRFSILDIPAENSPAGALRWRQLFDSPHGAFYFPWVSVEQSSGVSRTVPASGIVAGVYARCDTTVGLHRAPANEILHGVLDVSVPLNDVDLGTLNQRGINCLRPFTARGVRVWGARTTSSDTLQRYVTVRRITSAIIRAMNQDLQWVVFEPNTPALWKRVLRNVSFFLYDLWKRGYFTGENPEEAFFVKCDEENNPNELRDQGILVVDVGVAPVRPAEYVVFRVTQEVEAGAEQEA